MKREYKRGARDVYGREWRYIYLIIFNNKKAKKVAIPESNFGKAYIRKEGEITFKLSKTEKGLNYYEILLNNKSLNKDFMAIINNEISDFKKSLLKRSFFSWWGIDIFYIFFL